jgi:transcriptional regulator
MEQFTVDDEDMIFDHLENNSFGVVFSVNKDIPTATHLPFILDRKNRYLYGHFARPNPQGEGINEQDVLVVFQGPHSHISSSWYETNLSVPSWNYTAVHVYGVIEIIDDGEELQETLNQMVMKYEDGDSNYRLDDTNHEFIYGMQKGIVGFKLKITKLGGKRKLSQNHSRECQEQVIES